MVKQQRLQWSYLVQYMDSISLLDSSWQLIVADGLAIMDDGYLQAVNSSCDFLPHSDLVFSAFKQPLSKIRYVLLGESPYPRAQSANGYAFWDNAIGSIWSRTGLSKELNRATSLRNFVKMLLYIRGDLGEDFSQSAIAALDKTYYIQTINELFSTLLEEGFLLLNSSLIYSDGKVPYHAKNWRPFIDYVLTKVVESNPDVTLILLGKISEKFADSGFKNVLVAEHPYNLSFIKNPLINDFFKPFDLLGVRDV